MRICICIPVYDDWDSATVLLSKLDVMASSLEHAVDVLLVDDGSSQALPKTVELPQGKIGRASVLRLRRNLGHQRAIALGLTHLYVQSRYELIVVMDGDGEDAPETVPALLQACAEHDFSRAVFARRVRRSEGLVFRAGYVAFKLLHGLLTGRKVEVGNYSALPASVLARLVVVSEIWNHYAAAVAQARLPTALVPIERAPRIAGQSKMNLTALVAHGLSAISVYGDTVGVRMLVFTALLASSAVLAMGAVVAIRFCTDWAIPGWATNAFGFLLLALLNSLGLGLLAALSTLSGRTQTSFLPLRDYQYFILDEIELR